MFPSVHPASSPVQLTPDAAALRWIVEHESLNNFRRILAAARANLFGDDADVWEGLARDRFRVELPQAVHKTLGGGRFADYLLASFVNEWHRVVNWSAVCETLADEWSPEVIARMDEDAAAEREAIADAEAEYAAMSADADGLVGEIARGYRIGHELEYVETPSGSWEPVGGPDDWLADAEKVPA